MRVALSYALAFVHICGMDASDRRAPNCEDIADLALSVQRALPDAFRTAADAVMVRVEEFADQDALAALGVDDPYSLTGLYDGVPMTEKSFADQPDRPDTIWLFRRAILDEWIERENVSLRELVTHIYIHELAHHFGWSDDDIASIDQWWK